MRLMRLPKDSLLCTRYVLCDLLGVPQPNPYALILVVRFLAVTTLCIGGKRTPEDHVSSFGQQGILTCDFYL